MLSRLAPVLCALALVVTACNKHDEPAPAPNEAAKPAPATPTPTPTAAPTPVVPTPADPAAQEIDPSIVLIVPINGDVRIGGTAVPDAELDRMFHAAFVRDKNTQVVFKVDTGVQHSRVVNLMDRAKSAGLRRLAIGTNG
jgi:biopolymer transport protein ExbD